MASKGVPANKLVSVKGVSLKMITIKCIDNIDSRCGSRKNVDRFTAERVPKA